MTDISASFRPQPPFDTAVLAAWLAPRLPGFAGPLHIERFAGGQSNPTYKLVAPGGAWVMRTRPGPVATLLPSAHAIEREFRVLSALACTDVPVPGVHVLCEDESVIGRAFYVMQHVEGRVLWDQTLPGLSRSERAAIYDEMNRVIAALHRVDWQAVGLSGFGRAGGYLARQIARWSKQYQASATDPVPEMDRLIEWLPAHIPPGDETAIVHGDFRLDNMIFDARAPRVLAVLDWELATLGHPLADFSYHCMAWHVAPPLFRGIAGADLPSLGIPAEAEYVRRYCERTGRDPDAGIAHWAFYLAYNLFRSAAIAQGIVRRALDGTAADPGGARFRAQVVPAAQAAWRIASRLAGA